jgi:hypothetical protein
MIKTIPFALNNRSLLMLPAAAALVEGEPQMRPTIADDTRGPGKLPSMAFFETRSENAVSASLHLSSAWALERWRGILPRTGTSNSSRCAPASLRCPSG